MSFDHETSINEGSIDRSIWMKERRRSLRGRTFSRSCWVTKRVRTCVEFLKKDLIKRTYNSRSNVKSSRNCPITTRMTARVESTSKVERDKDVNTRCNLNRRLRKSSNWWNTIPAVDFSIRPCTKNFFASNWKANSLFRHWRRRINVWTTNAKTMR